MGLAFPLWSAPTVAQTLPIPAPKPQRATADRAVERPAEAPRGGIAARIRNAFADRRASAPIAMAQTHGSQKRALLNAYPGAFTIEGNVVRFPSGETVVWDDGREKSASEVLVDADVEDMFRYPYRPASAGAFAPQRPHDPGRVRSDAFFRALYGQTAREVGASVRAVPWVPDLGGGTVAVSKRFGIDRKIEAISRELQGLPRRFHRYLVPPAGGFVWRQIAGTRRLSVHSFGAAVDIATTHANYWRWDGAPAGGPIPYRNQIPLEIVEVFERHCFIWGGRWYHYDTMHFEYRPELLPACRR